MGARLTGVSTPLGGLTWEYTSEDDKQDIKPLSVDFKIKVFISSICGRDKYDIVRAELKQKIEASGLATVYTFEGANASTLAAKMHYTSALEDSDICIFLIDNADGISPGVQTEIDIVQKRNIKALYYFCDENSKEKTSLEESLMGATFAKSKTVHKFSDIGQNGANALICDIITIYHYYCKGKLNGFSEHSKDLYSMDITGTEAVALPTIPKSILKDIDKCKKFFLKFILGETFFYSQDEAERSSEIDEWCFRFLPVLFEGQSIKCFNTGMFLEILKNQQLNDYFPIVEDRWKAIQAYFLGDVQKCINQLETALEKAKQTKQATWIIKDILIDLRNQNCILDAINNCFRSSKAQEELLESKEEIYYPILDRINESLLEKCIENMYKEKIESPYTITFGSNLEQFCELLASSYIVSMYNGSLTHILTLYDKIKNILFYLCNKYDNWQFRRDMLKLTIFEGNEKEVKGILSSYPEILNNLTASDALSIINFCNNKPVEYKKFICQLLSFGTVGYYLHEDDFKKIETVILRKIHDWINTPNANIFVGQSIFNNLSGIAFRLSQNDVSDICCIFIKKGFSRWFTDMFKFIANYVDLSKMDLRFAENLVNEIIGLFEDANFREQINYFPHFLSVLRCQDKNLTEGIDKKVAEFFPQYYIGDYKLATTEITENDLTEHIQNYVQHIQHCNETQGKDGAFFIYGTNDIARIKAILYHNNTALDNITMDSVILTIADTILKSKEGIRIKLDAISLLICIALKYPNDFNRNADVFKKIFEEQNEIETHGYGMDFSNINSISVKVCLQFLFSIIGFDTYTDILELMPYIQNDIPTTISVSKVIADFLYGTKNLILPSKIEAIVLQNVLQWLNSNQLDIRRNATKILFGLARNPENIGVVNHQLMSLVDSDGVYIKNLIMRNILEADGITDSTREYVVSKCERDVNFVVRMVCEDEKSKHNLAE